LAGRIVQDVLRNNGFQIEVLEDHFPVNCPDTEWLMEAGKQGWVVLSKDKRIRRRNIEKQALIDANVAAFILTSGNLTGEQMGEALVKAHNRMIRFIEKHPRPFIATVTRDGRVVKMEI
jgi:predicted nuclease of predicted toxin-antitoxin system